MKDLLQEYLHFCRRVKGLSETTLASYADSCHVWLRWIQEENGEEPGLEHWTKENALAWLTAQKRAGMHQSTRRTRVSALRSFGAWMIEKGRTQVNPWQNLRTPVNEEQRQPCPTPEQVRALLDACDRMPNPTRGAMAKAMLVLQAQAGLRLCETLSVRVQDIHLTSTPPRVYVEEGKGDKAGSVPLSAYSVHALSAWLSLRPNVNLCNLFYLTGPNLGTRPFTEGAFNDLLQTLKTIARIGDADITAHALRRFAGTMCAQQEGASIADAQKLLRQANLGTTLRYIKSTSRLPNIVEGILPVAPAPAAPRVQAQTSAEDNRVKAEHGRRKPGWRR